VTGEPGASAPDAVPVTEDIYAPGEAGGRVIRGSSLRVAGSIAGVLAGAISAPLVVRHLGVTNYGRYLTVASVIFVITALTEGGLTNVAVRLFSVGDASRRRALIANLTGLRLALGAIGAVVAVAFGAIAGYEQIIIVGLALGAVGYMLGCVQNSYAVSLSARLRLGALAGVDLLRSLAATVLLVGLVIAGSGLTGFYLVAVVVQALVLVVTAAVVRGEVPLVPAFQRSTCRELLRETAIYALAATLGAIYFQVALISMSLLDPGLQTGYYAIAFRVVEILNGIPWLLAASVLPVLAVAARQDHERLRYVARRVFEGALITGGWVALTLILGASFAIRFIAGPKGDPSIDVLRIMGIGVMATYVVASFGFVLLALGRFRQLVIANAGALILAIVCSASLIPTLHARGGAITTAVLECSLAAGYIAFLSREGITPARSFLLRFAPAIAVAFGAGVVALMASAVIAVIVGSGVYFASLSALRAFPSELIDALPWRR
jgi:O-antigen/teichoic acid export membrane protein